MGTSYQKGLAISLAVLLGSILGLAVALSQPPSPAQAGYGPTGVWNSHCQARANAWDTTSGSNLRAYNKAQLTYHMLPSGYRYCTHFHSQLKVVTTAFQTLWVNKQCSTPDQWDTYGYCTVSTYAYVCEDGRAGENGGWGYHWGCH